MVFLIYLSHKKYIYIYIYIYKDCVIALRYLQLVYSLDIRGRLCLFSNNWLLSFHRLQPRFTVETPGQSPAHCHITVKTATTLSPHLVSNFVCRNTDIAELCLALICIIFQCLPPSCIFSDMCKVEVTYHHWSDSTNGPRLLQSADDKTLLNSSPTIKSREDIRCRR